LNLDVGVASPDPQDVDDADAPDIDLAEAAVSTIMLHYGVDKLTAEQMSQVARGDRPGLNSIAVAEE